MEYLIYQTNELLKNMLIEKLPGKMNKWLYTNWGEEMLKNSRIYGPVLMKRYTGEFENIKRILKFGH